MCHTRSRQLLNLYRGKLSCKSRRAGITLHIMEDFLKNATEYQWLLILTTDYTSIQTKQRTQEDKASAAKTMSTTIVKAYQETSGG